MLDRLLRRFGPRPSPPKHSGDLIRKPLPGGGTLALRDTVADTGIFWQIFEQRQYDISFLRRVDEIRGLYAKMVAAGHTPFILDAGANIGASAVYFGDTYGECRVVCLEPAPDNFRLLRQNTAGRNVELHEAGIGPRDGTAMLIDPGEGAWGYRTATVPDAARAVGTVAIKSIATLVAEKLSEGLAPFIAKIDIEGAETDLFDPPNDWFDAFPLVVIELHDWMLPGRAVSRGFLTCCSGRDRDFVCRGEAVFSIANRPLEAEPKRGLSARSAGIPRGADAPKGGA